MAAISCLWVYKVTKILRSWGCLCSLNESLVYKIFMASKNIHTSETTQCQQCVGNYESAKPWTLKNLVLAFQMSHERSWGSKQSEESVNVQPLQEQLAIWLGLRYSWLEVIHSWKIVPPNLILQKLRCSCKQFCIGTVVCKSLVKQVPSQQKHSCNSTLIN